MRAVMQTKLQLCESSKNEIIGHPLKKEMAVLQGILEPVVRMTNNTLVQPRQNDKTSFYNFPPRPLCEEEHVRLYGLHVISSVAAGAHI